MIDTIKKEIQEFEQENIKITDGLYFNQKETITRNINYYLSNFETGETDEDGFKKYFYNIVRNPCDVATKMIDFDVADIRFLTAGGGNELATWLFDRDFKFWAKDNEFGLVLNRIVRELPRMGSAVIKTINGKPHFVDLRNFIVEQSADTLDDARYIIETHYYTPVEFRRIAKERKWNNADDVLSAFRNSNDDFITVYERYGEVSEDELEKGGDPNKYHYAQMIIAIISGEEGEGEEQKEETFTLASNKVDSHPYSEFHFEKIPGRWLGISRIEVLRDPQIRLNELTNLKVKASYWATMRIFQTRDDGLKRNLLTEVKSGEILNVEDYITAVPTEERNLAAYNQEEQRWMSNRDENTFNYDVVKGERMPSRTPFGTAQLAASMVTSYYNFIKENLALDIKRYLFDKVIPSFKKTASQEHILRLAGEDLEQLRLLFKKIQKEKTVLNFILKNHRVPTKDEVQLIEAMPVVGKEMAVKIPANFYDNLKYKIDIVITGEQRDIRVEAANLQMALQAITQDPTLLTDPTKRKIIGKVLEDGGLSLDELAPQTPPTLEQLAQQQPIKQVGGGISKPTIANSPVLGQQNVTK